MTPKVKSTNILFKDFKDQPPGKKVVIFMKESMRGSLQCDFVRVLGNLAVFYTGDQKNINEATIVAAFPIDMNTSWILLDGMYIEAVSTEVLAEKGSHDAKELEELNKKWFPNEKSPVVKKQQPMMMIPMEDAKEEEENTNSVSYGHYL